MDIIRFGKKNWYFIIIIALWFLFSAPYFLKGLVPFPSKYLVSFFPPWNATYGMAVKNNAMPDVITQIYPWKKLTIETWKQGQIPLWNPYSFTGTPHASNYQSAVFHPFNILFFILPFIDAWSILILLQPLLAGLFTFLFLRELGCSKIGSAVASIGYMFSGFIVCWMAYGTLGYAALFLPLILWSIKHFIRTKSSLMFAVGILGTACSYLSGHFQISFYISIFCFAFCTYELVTGEAKGRAALSMMIPVLGIFVSAPQLFLTYDAYVQSIRAANTQLKEVIPWQYLVTFFSPDIYGNPVTRNDWFGHYAEWAGYIGVIPLLLSFYGVFYSRHPKRWFFIGFLIISLLLAYASPLSTLLFLWRIPVLATSAASRIIILTGFSLCILAAFGFEQLFLDWKKEVWNKRIVFTGIACFIVFLIWVAVYIFKPFPPQWIPVAKRNILLPTALLGLFFAITGFGFFKKGKYVYVAALLIMCLTCFDSYRFASKWMPFDPKEYVYPTVKVLSFLQKEIGINRVFGNIGNEVGSMFSIPLIEGYDAMYQSRYGEFINTVSNGIVSEPERSVVQFDKHGKYNIPVLQLLGVKYIVHRLSDGRNIWAFPFWQYGEDVFTSIYRDEHYEVMEYRDAFPRAFLASSYIVKTDKQEIIDTLFQKDFDRRNALVLEEKPDIDPKEGLGSADIVSYTPTRITIKTSTTVPQLLFLSDVYDEGWEATVDGKKVKILRADYDFRAIPLSEGNHSIEYRYYPVPLRMGTVVQCVSIFVLFFCISFTRRRI